MHITSIVRNGSQIKSDLPKTMSRERLWDTVKNLKPNELLQVNLTSPNKFRELGSLPHQVMLEGLNYEPSQGVTGLILGKKKMVSPLLEVYPEQFKPDLITFEKASQIPVKNGNFREYMTNFIKTATKSISEERVAKKGKNIGNLGKALALLMQSKIVDNLTPFHIRKFACSITFNIAGDIHADEKSKHIDMILKEGGLYEQLRKDVQIKFSAGKKEEALNFILLYTTWANAFDAYYYFRLIEEGKASFDKIMEITPKLVIDQRNVFVKTVLNGKPKVFFYLLDNPGENVIDKILEEILLDVGHEVVQVAKESYSWDDVTIGDESKLLKRTNFEQFTKFISSGMFRSISGGWSRPAAGFDDASPQFIDEISAAKREGKEIIFLYKGGGNLYGTWLNTQPFDGFYLFNIKEAQQMAILKALGAKDEDIKFGDLAIVHKPKNTKGEWDTSFLSILSIP